MEIRLAVAGALIVRRRGAVERWALAPGRASG
jgi:hypothetical protein